MGLKLKTRESRKSLIFLWKITHFGPRECPQMGPKSSQNRFENEVGCRNFEKSSPRGLREGSEGEKT